MLKPKLYLPLAVMVLMAIAVSFRTGPSLQESVEGTKKNAQTNVPSNKKVNTSSASSPPTTNSVTNSSPQTSSINGTPSSNGNANKDVKHIDMLSPEMRQAIKDKLFHHGPKTVIYHDDGRISLPANGRYTQMPVAVQMPDGTIKIQEYSVLPHEPKP